MLPLDKNTDEQSLGIFATDRYNNDIADADGT